jgi:hypothetical protein
LRSFFAGEEAAAEIFWPGKRRWRSFIAGRYPGQSRGIFARPQDIGVYLKTLINLGGEKKFQKIRL